MNNIFICIVFTLFLGGVSFAQENYEIQVYASPTTQKGVTMAELHSNFTFDGEKNTVNNLLPTNHVFHETIEITHGFAECFEIGFYFFNTLGDNNRSNYVGSHIRPRITAPESWNLPVGLSLSAEGGYQKLAYSEDDWSVEIRPIIDKQFTKLYLSFNPTVEKSLHGANVGQGFIFSPNFKIGYSFTEKFAPGIEYYGSMGPIHHFEPSSMQQHQVFLCVDILSMPKWELNFGYGVGLTSTTDHSIFKILLGRRF